MLDSLFGLNVLREIPSAVFTSLMTGEYSLHGGVIRWAAGTDSAGQIVQHLIPTVSQGISGSLFAPIGTFLTGVNTYQLHNLGGQMDAVAQQVGNISGQVAHISGQLNNVAGQVNAVNATTQQVLQIANTTMMLSGLSLAVSMVSFAVLTQKLNKLDSKLNEIQAEVKAIHEFLKLEERSKLIAALEDLFKITQVENADNRRAMLLNSKNVLAPIRQKYKELLTKADSLETAMACEEYFCLTSLAHTRCLAELGMLEIARRDLEEANKFWIEQARRIGNEFLLKNHPERFLFSDFAKEIPISVLAEWLDFVKGEKKGYAWIDELRSKTGSWYNSNSYAIGYAIGKTMRSVLGSESKQHQKQKVIPSLQKLVARNNVLTGFIAQYELLEKQNITPTEFEQKVMAVAQSAAVDGYLILQPKDN